MSVSLLYSSGVSSLCVANSQSLTVALESMHPHFALSPPEAAWGSWVAGQWSGPSRKARMLLVVTTINVFYLNIGACWDCRRTLAGGRVSSSSSSELTRLTRVPFITAITPHTISTSHSNTPYIISHSSAATRLRCSGNFHDHLTANFHRIHHKHLFLAQC